MWLGRVVEISTLHTERHILTNEGFRFSGVLALE